MRHGNFWTVSLALTALGAIAAGSFVIFAPSVANAASNEGWYTAVRGAVTFVEDSELDDPAIPAGVTVELTGDVGFGVSGALGYKMRSGFRPEFELVFRRNELDEITAAATVFGTTVSASASVDGNVNIVAPMANIYYDIPTGMAWSLYLGGGIGLGNVSIDSDDLGVDEGDLTLAFQGMAGLRYDLSKRFALEIGYRFLGTTDPEIEGTEGEYRTHSAELGLMYTF